jgi:nitroreductase
VELSDAIRRRHMTRTFTGDPVDRAVLDGLLALALRAPSAGNTQGRDLVVLADPAHTSRFWEAATDEAWRRRSTRFPGMSAAPVVVLAFGDPLAYDDRYRQPDKADADGTAGWPVPYWHVDAGFVVLQVLLLAEQAGLGAAFLGNFRHEDAVKTAFGVPTTMAWTGTVLLGHPAAGDRPSASLARGRRAVDDAVHRGGW